MRSRLLARMATSLVAIAVTTVALNVHAAAQAGETPDAGIGRMSPLTVQIRTTEEIRAMAAGGSGQLLTFNLKPGKDSAGGIGIQYLIICYLIPGNPWGGGAPDADILVDGLVVCDDWVHLANLRVQLYRSNNLVAANEGTFPYVYGVYGTTGVPNCTAGTYFGAVTAVLARWDAVPPVISGSFRGGDVGIGCGA